MTQDLAERHHNGMCGGGCRYCYEDQLYEDDRRQQDERAQEQAYYDEMMQIAEAEHYEEMWWNEWLSFFQTKTCNCGAPAPERTKPGMIHHKPPCPLYCFNPDEIPF